MDIASIAPVLTDLLAQWEPFGLLGKGLALGLTVLGAGIAIGKLAAAALEGAARQPEAHGRLQGMMILAIAFIEALALIALLFGAFAI